MLYDRSYSTRKCMGKCLKINKEMYGKMLKNQQVPNPNISVTIQFTVHLNCIPPLKLKIKKLSSVNFLVHFFYNLQQLHKGIFCYIHPHFFPRFKLLK